VIASEARKTKYGLEDTRLELKLFATELRGKTVMTEDGQILGVLSDFLVEMKTGRIQSLLVDPAETVEIRLYKTDPAGRLLLSFRSMKAVRDVIVTQLAE
jgi:sporulation protein YlmC with PRC-barrel domain